MKFFRISLQLNNLLRMILYHVDSRDRELWQYRTISYRSQGGMDSLSALAYLHEIQFGVLICITKSTAKALFRPRRIRLLESAMI